jgi:hypothetical protein
MFKTSRTAMSTFPHNARLLVGRCWETPSILCSRSYSLKIFTFHKILSSYRQQNRSKSSFSEYILAQIQKEMSSNVEFQKSVNDLYKLSSVTNSKKVHGVYRMIIAKGQFVKTKMQEGLDSVNSILSCCVPFWGKIFTNWAFVEKYIKGNDFFLKMNSLTPKINSALQLAKNFFDQFEEDTSRKAQSKAKSWVENIAKARMRKKNETSDHTSNMLRIRPRIFVLFYIKNVNTLEMTRLPQEL